MVAALEHAAISGGPDSLSFWAAHYLSTRCMGDSPNTLDTKARDLANFIRWFVAANGLDTLRPWRARDTQTYLRSLEGRGLAARSINRAFATPAPLCPLGARQTRRLWQHRITHGRLRELATEEAPYKKIERADMRALFKAAEERVGLTDARRYDAVGTDRADPTRRQRPRRDLAMLALLYYNGLRATELVMLCRDPYDGTHLHHVARKGHNRS